jgi:gliding motility-associated-like protein
LDLNTFCSKELAGIEVENNVVEICNPDECVGPSVVATINDLENPGCSGEGTGSVVIQASGSATGNYFYSINNGSAWISFVPGELLNDLPPGQYNLRVGDKEMDLCPVGIEFTMAEPSGSLFANVKNTTLSFPDQPTGSITIDQISGGTSPYRSKISLKVPSFPDQQLELDWSSISMNPNTMEYELQYNNLYAGKYEVTIQDENGCKIVLEVDLDFDRTILIPNVFTPNGDGYNDTFYIRNLPEVGTQLVVANKWGKTVFESKDYRNNWKGGELPEGIYFYTMVTNAGTKYNGWLEIWRGPAF